MSECIRCAKTFFDADDSIHTCRPCETYQTGMLEGELIQIKLFSEMAANYKKLLSFTQALATTECWSSLEVVENRAIQILEELGESCACLGTCKKYPFTCSGLPEWISVKDRLPPKELEVIINDNGVAKIGIYSSDCYGDKFFTTNFEQFLNVDNVTHWMPLPEAPKE